MKVARSTLPWALCWALLACRPAPSDAPADASESESSGEGDGDGDGEPSTGDGDGEPSPGDGDGEPSPGDGDGEPSPGDGDGDEPAPARVLFVGNSYTASNDLAGLVAMIADGAGVPMTTSAMTVGGAWVEDHLANPAVSDAIMQDPWDAVVLQGQSVQPVIAPVEFVAAVVEFSELVLGVPARLLLYQTWPRAEGNEVLGQLGMSQQQMYEALAQGYTDAAEASGAERARVGEAWMDALALMPPIELYAGDGSHPSFAGSYLAACVIFTQYSAVPCAASEYLPPQLEVQQRDALAAVADGLP